MDTARKLSEESLYFRSLLWCAKKKLHDQNIKSGLVKSLVSNTKPVKYFLILTGLSLCWACNTYGQILKYLHTAGYSIAALLVSLICLLFLTVVLMRKLKKITKKLPHSIKILYIYCITVSVFFAATYTAGVFGPNPSLAGADRRSALEEPIYALLRGESPYDRTTIHGTPITPMPGALVFAFPWVEMKVVSLQNVMWFLVFATVTLNFYKNTWQTVLVLSWIIPCSGLMLYDFGVGGDYVCNVFYVISLLMLLYRSICRDLYSWKTDLISILFGISLSSRPIYVVALIILAGSVHVQGRRCIRAVVLAASAYLLCTAPIYFLDPVHFSPLHTTEFLRFYPSWLQAKITVPALGILCAASSFFVNMTERRILLVMGISLGVMVIPAELLRAASVHFIDSRETSELGYMCPATIPITLWLFSILFGFKRSLKSSVTADQ